MFQINRTPSRVSKTRSIENSNQAQKGGLQDSSGVYPNYRDVTIVTLDIYNVMMSRD